MKAIIWSKPLCPFCDKAIHELKKAGAVIEIRKIGEGWTKEQLLEDVPNARSVPQIIIDGKLIGGYTELMKSGELDS